MAYRAPQAEIDDPGRFEIAEKRIASVRYDTVVKINEDLSYGKVEEENVEVEDLWDGNVADLVSSDCEDFGFGTLFVPPSRIRPWAEYRNRLDIARTEHSVRTVHRHVV